MPADDTTTEGLPSGSDRLDSWKDIAVYLKRDVRTVRRWEQKEHLPVHRHQHSKRGSVYASKTELDAWWNHGRRPMEASPSTAPRRPWLGSSIVLVVVLLALSAGYSIWYHSASALRSEPSRPKLAVLPFENLSGDPEKEYLSDGFTEELITQLGRSQLNGLGVIARTSAMRYKQLPKSADEIGRELDVDYLLEGSVQTSGDRIRITAQLIRVRDQTHLWAEEYERPFSDVLALQRDISQAVAHQIHLKLTRPGDRLGVHPTDPEAYQLYLKGRYLLNRRTGGRLLARQYLEQAITKDQTYAAAYAGLAEAYIRIARFGPQPASEAFPKAEAAVTRALELDGTLPAAHSAAATIRLMRYWDFDGAEREHQSAIALNPSDANAHASYAHLLTMTGHIDAAILEQKRALELDPARADLMTGLGTAYVFARQYDEALRQYRQALQLDPTYVPAADGIADLHARTGKYPEAAAEQIRTLNMRRQPDLASAFEREYREHGYAAASQLLDRQALKHYMKQPPEMNSWNIAFTYARLGNREAAFEWLGKAYAIRDPGLLQLRVDPDVDNLRSDPRFSELLRQISFPP